MAARPGEENVATLFGDIHYFYSSADVKPRHHRFDKGSYVYLFENARERKCRIEVANHPGTDDQDAFAGYLDQTQVHYSYKHSCKVSLAVADTVNQSEWHLPTYDPRNENKYHYKLHSLDIYFWTQNDALQFVNGVRRVLPAAQVEVLDEPGPPPQPAGMSAVVQNLENMAVSDPRYGASSQPSSFPFPGPPPVSAVASSSPPAPAAPSSFVPIPYNPAAPAAPETIRHREKTPPPDEDPLNPLSVAVAYDYHRQPFTPGLPPPSQFPLSPGLPPSVTSPGLPPAHFGSAAQHPGLQRAATMPLQPGLPSPGLTSPFTGAQGLPPPPPPPQPPQTQQQPQPQTLPQPVINPSQSAPPVGGYSNYSYTPQTQQGHSQSGSQDYSIHSQLYRPTEAESYKGKPPQPYQPKPEKQGRLEENAGRLERGVTGMFKKFEKRFN
ncbi:hypothetical protein S40285_04323 [Stachybotrys chlorohalonatus IBT 40285]|uniref:RNA recognition motif-containing protein n=1 Tax=Stachybotrys chlorohalonatus (strain IBT 40285) TaxID=1283841 RepID=A0A084QNN0_STAC4|nr:hypothetical protein S40285_04323 [Stachybotrys chlorohalonata IBT 40285]